MKLTVSPKTRSLVGSWFRAALAAVVAQYMAGETDPGILLNAGLAAFLAVVARWLNPKDRSRKK